MCWAQGTALWPGSCAAGCVMKGLEVAARYANACGALAVSRHGCAPSYPSYPELRHLLIMGSDYFALRKDPVAGTICIGPPCGVCVMTSCLLLPLITASSSKMASRTGRDDSCYRPVQGAGL